MSPAKIVPSGVHAVLAVDPGGTTGVAGGYVELQSTLKATLATLSRRKAVEVEGPWLDHGKQIAKIMSNFVFTANVENGLPLDNIHIVFEDFVLRMPASTANLTSIWVAAGAVAMYQHRAPLLSGEGEVELDPVPIIWQQAGQAKSLASNDRLRLWDLWEVGSAHKRDAWRHFAVRVNKLVGV
jgi:hypothetical protein